jgi:hypothetical protein
MHQPTTTGALRGETRPGGELGDGESPKGVSGGGEGGGGIEHTGGERGMQDDTRLTGSRSRVTSIAYTPKSISGDGGGARVPSRGMCNSTCWSFFTARLASIKGEEKPPDRRRWASCVLRLLLPRFVSFQTE